MIDDALTLAGPQAAYHEQVKRLLRPDPMLARDPQGHLARGRGVTSAISYTAAAKASRTASGSVGVPPSAVMKKPKNPSSASSSASSSLSLRT
jgi:hypothetical protein